MQDNIHLQRKQFTKYNFNLYHCNTWYYCIVCRLIIETLTLHIHNNKIVDA